MPWSWDCGYARREISSGCYPAAVHNVAENRIDFKRFICFGINRAKAGELRTESREVTCRNYRAPVNESTNGQDEFVDATPSGAANRSRVQGHLPEAPFSRAIVHRLRGTTNDIHNATLRRDEMRHTLTFYIWRDIKIFRSSLWQMKSRTSFRVPSTCWS